MKIGDSVYICYGCSIDHYKIVDVIEKVIFVNFPSISSSVGGIMVSIAAFQAVDPSSILGHRMIFRKFKTIRFLIKFLFFTTY